MQVPYVKVAPEDILKVQFPRFTTLDMRPTNTDISLAVAGLLTFFNSTTACLICAQADCEYKISHPHEKKYTFIHTWGESSQAFPTSANNVQTFLFNVWYLLTRVSTPKLLARTPTVF